MDNKPRQPRTEEETREYLARIRRTISESNALLSQVELRMAETDRALASMGLTREQVSAIQFSPEQIEKVNKELVRRGLPKLEEKIIISEENTRPGSDERLTGSGRAAEPNMDSEDSKEDLDNRQRKFNVMMNNFRL